MLFFENLFSWANLVDIPWEGRGELHKKLSFRTKHLKPFLNDCGGDGLHATPINTPTPIFTGSIPSGGSEFSVLKHLEINLNEEVDSSLVIHYTDYLTSPFEQKVPGR